MVDPGGGVRFLQVRGDGVLPPVDPVGQGTGMAGPRWIHGMESPPPHPGDAAAVRGGSRGWDLHSKYRGTGATDIRGLFNWSTERRGN